MSSKSRLDPESWKQFWNQSSVTSMYGRFENSYDAEIFEFWEEEITERYPDVIDLACGNGALAWIANDLLTDRAESFNVTGIDFADIEPFRQLKKNPDDYPGIKFIGNTLIEELPLESNSVDMAISQWGVEYSDISKTIPELGRVLKDRSKICLVCHYHDSDILKDARAKIDKFYACVNSELLDRFLEMDQLYLKHNSLQSAEKDPDYMPVLARLNRSLVEFQIAMTNSTDQTRFEFMKNIGILASVFSEPKNFTRKDRGKVIRTFFDDVRMNIGRYEDLASVSLSKDKQQKLQSLLKHAGFNFKVNEPLIHKGDGSVRPLGDVGLKIVAVRG